MIGNHNNLKLYGQTLWNLIHKFSFGEYSSFYIFIYSLTELIPCPVCKYHYNENMKIMPIEYYTNPKCLFMWTYLLHDKVNNLKNIPSPKCSVLKEKYKTAYINQTKEILDQLCFSYFTLSVEIEDSKSVLFFRAFVTSSFNLLRNNEYKQVLEKSLIINNINNIIFENEKEYSSKCFKWSYDTYVIIKNQLQESAESIDKLQRFFV